LDASLLQIKEVNQYYGGSHILRSVNIAVEMGKVTTVLGRNGVGKTTLLKSLMGIVPIKSGDIALSGQSINKLTSFERVRAGIGFVPQGREIFSRLTVEENIQMGLSYLPASTRIDPEIYELFPPS
jgi:urea transport system ATP-binding protein